MCDAGLAIWHTPNACRVQEVQSLVLPYKNKGGGGKKERPTILNMQGQHRLGQRNTVHCILHDIPSEY